MSGLEAALRLERIDSNEWRKGMIGNWNDSDTQRIADSFDYMPTMSEVAERIEEEPFCVQWKEEDGESFDYMGFVNETSDQVYSMLWNKFR